VRGTVPLFQELHHLASLAYKRRPPAVALAERTACDKTPFGANNRKATGFAGGSFHITKLPPLTMSISASSSASCFGRSC
jgi:hypothetical protein